MQVEYVKPYILSEDAAYRTISSIFREFVARFELISSPFVIISFGSGYDECNNYLSFLILLFWLAMSAISAVHILSASFLYRAFLFFTCMILIVKYLRCHFCSLLRMQLLLSAGLQQYH